VAEALRLLFARDEARRAQLDEAIQIGLDEADPGAFVLAEMLRAELAKRLAARRA
jgi:Arc/MetJ-type ribon-helix-helix transcriptional regulator